MASNYDELALSIVDALGGKGNVKQVAHCATRLRFSLREKDTVDRKKLEGISGVLGIQVASGTYQVLIGLHVADVYDTLLATTGVKGAGEVDVAQVEAASGQEKIGLFDRFTRMMAAVFGPYIPIIATSGIVGGIMSLLGSLGVVDMSGTVYQTFNAISNSLIYFFPILLAFTAAKHFKCNPYVAAVIGASLMYPGLSGLLQTGSTINFLGLNFTAFNFASSFIPILLAVFCMSYVEKWLKEVLPQSLQIILIPLVCLALLVPASVLLFGPMGGLLANGITSVYLLLFKVRLIGCVVFGAFIIIIIMLGVHWAVVPIMLGVLAEQGFEYGLTVGGMGNYALIGVCLAVMIMSKDKETKATAGSAVFVNALSGVTEPGLYGVVLKNKKYFLPLLIGGASGGLICGIFDVAVTQFAFTGILGFGAYLSARNLFWYVVAVLVSTIVGFVLTFMIDRLAPQKKIGSR